MIHRIIPSFDRGRYYHIVTENDNSGMGITIEEATKALRDYQKFKYEKKNESKQNIPQS